MKLCISICHFAFHYADTTLCMTLSKRFLAQIDYVIIIIKMADVKAREAGKCNTVLLHEPVLLNASAFAILLKILDTGAVPHAPRVNTE